MFKHLRIVELASVLAGPATALFFAELGAQVIKIENPNTNGDVTRSWKLPSEDSKSKDSAYFKSVNFKKKSVFLDAGKKEDRVKIYRYISNADIVIVNFKVGDDVKFELDYKKLKSINSKLIYAAIKGFPDGDDRLAYDLILQAETGFMSMNGTLESGPIKMPVALIDILAAHHLKEAILLALIKRTSTGKGSRVSVSLYDSAIASLANQATNWLLAKHNPKPQGSLHPNIAPYGEIFRTKDKSLVTFAIGSNNQFQSLCMLVGMEHLAKDSRFIDNKSRVENRNILFNLLESNLCNFTYRQLMSKSKKLQIPFAKIKSVKEVLSEETAQSQIIKIKGERLVSSIAFRFK